MITGRGILNSRSIVLGLAVSVLLPSRVSTQAPGRRAVGPDADRSASAQREVLVKFRERPSQSDRAILRGQVDADRDDDIGSVGVVRYRSRSLDADALSAFFASHPNVEYAEPNYIVRSTASPNDPGFAQLWGLQNVFQVGADIGAVGAWDISTGSRANVVAVIDTGFDYTHQDLAANVWSAPSSFTVTIGGATITCAAGTHGFNAILGTCDPMDDNNHGTHTAGTVGANGNNGMGVVGVNWTASVMGIKFLSAGGSGTISDAINAVEFAIQARKAFSTTGGANVRVLSNSWGGGGFSQALLDEIKKASTNDMLFVAAAGNNGSNNDTAPFYPASYAAANVVSVAATDSNDFLAGFSNYGSTSVALGAPGVGILSTTIGNTYSSFSGTSMATPHVAGAAALVLSHCTLDTAGVKNVLLNSVDHLSTMTGFTATGGRLNVNTAIRACASSLPPPPPPTGSVPAAPSGLGATSGPGKKKITLTWTASSGATNYTVSRSTTSGGPYSVVAAGVTGTSYQNTGLSSGRAYFYVVAANNAAGSSGNSNQASATAK